MSERHLAIINPYQARPLRDQQVLAGRAVIEIEREVLLQLNETSLSQLRRDHETGHLEHKIANASK